MSKFILWHPRLLSGALAFCLGVWVVPALAQHVIMDDDISILKVDGTVVTNTGKLFKLPGHPASMRSVVP